MSNAAASEDAKSSLWCIFARPSFDIWTFFRFGPKKSDAAICFTSKNGRYAFRWSNTIKCRSGHKEYNLFEPRADNHEIHEEHARESGARGHRCYEQIHEHRAKRALCNNARILHTFESISYIFSFHFLTHAVDVDELLVRLQTRFSGTWGASKCQGMHESKKADAWGWRIKGRWIFHQRRDVWSVKHMRGYSAYVIAICITCRCKLRLHGLW